MAETQLYLLLDANVFAGYYAPQTFTKNTLDAGDRIQTIIDSVRKGCSPQIKLLVPEICVAEAQTVLSKHANSKWKGKRKRDDKQAIHGRTYQGIVKKMRSDLHGGNLIESVPLQRYHVLAKHLVTPIDHHLHLKQQGNNNVVKELGGTDQLICGTAARLTPLLGAETLVFITTDYRLMKGLEKAQKVTEKRATAWGVIDVAKDIGIQWNVSIYPQAIHLSRISESKLRDLFGSWPLPLIKKKPRQRPRDVREDEIEELVDRYRAIGIGRDRLPYSPQMTALTQQFNKATGHSMSEGEVWTLLIARLKRGSGRL